jgi:hypothetical protein
MSRIGFLTEGKELPSFSSVRRETRFGAPGGSAAVAKTAKATEGRALLVPSE